MELLDLNTICVCPLPGPRHNSHILASAKHWVYFVLILIVMQFIIFTICVLQVLGCVNQRRISHLDFLAPPRLTFPLSMQSQEFEFSRISPLHLSDAASRDLEPAMPGTDCVPHHKHSALYNVTAMCQSCHFNMVLQVA